MVYGFFAPLARQSRTIKGMGRALTGLALPALLLSLLLGAQSARAQYGDTTEGTQESATYGGISQQEQQALDQKTRRFLEKFKEGRAPKNGGRHWDILTHHDHDQNGLSDHEGGQSTIEAGMDKAGKISAAKGSSRAEKINNAKDNAENCKNGWINGKVDGILCHNISSVIVDRGAAHGTDDRNKQGNWGEEHRVYDLTKEAVAEAKTAADTYSRRVIVEAADYDVNSTLPGRSAKDVGISDGGVGTDSKGRYGKLIVNADGSKSAVAPDIDVLHSEAAFLNEQAVNVIDREAKTLRALRLAGVDTSAGQTDADITHLIENTKADKVDGAIAQRIAERSTLGNKSCDSLGDTSLCTNALKNQQVRDVVVNKCLSDAGKDISAQRECRNTQKQQELVKKLSVSEIAAADASGKLGSAAYSAAQSKLTPDEKKEIQQNISKVKDCLQPGVWCWGGGGLAKGTQENTEGFKKGESTAFKKIKGDPGSGYSDTRELVFNRASQALRGPANQIAATMKNADFNEKTDAKTKAGSGIEYYKGWEELQKRAVERAKENGTNPATATTTQILRQDRSRGDGGTLGGLSSNQRPQPTQPPAAPPSVSRQAPTGNLMNPEFLVPGGGL